jgi:lipid A ethanolaminephosphotransferase
VPALPKLTANRLCLLVALWIVLTGNLSFWRQFQALQGAEQNAWVFTASLFLALLGLNLFLARLLAPGRLLKWTLTVLLLLSAVASWFMDTYGVAIDSGMIRNTIETNPAEARDFLGWSLIWRVLWQGVLPTWFVWRAKLPMHTWLGACRDYLVGAAAGLVLLFGAALPMYSSYASYFRNNDEARYLLAPANVLVGSVTLLRKARHSNVPFQQVGLDAKREPTSASKPLLVLLVVGETARAANFSLGGYARHTNPLLQKRDVLYFNNVRSCGTATAISLPCMFSDLPREEFDLSRADRRDNVLDVLQRAGLALTWIDNQSGCKKVCDRVPNETAEAYHPQSCRDGECLDDALLYALDAKLPKIKADSIIVLHAMGSHGPTYHRRVPDDHQVFKPICPSERIENCSDEQIRNSYDNSIAYTDFVLAGLIDRLKAAEENVDSVLLYISDHGESLGEKGLYLHGQPYMIAPDVQKQVPMILWFSQQAGAHIGVNVECMRHLAATPLTHDNLSHTLLGLLTIQTSLYRPALDASNTCRS